MAVTYRGKKAGESIEWTSDNGKISLGYNETHVLVADSKTESKANILTVPELPIPGFTVGSLGSVCRSLTPRQDTKQPRVWYVDARYIGEPTQEDPEENGDPLEWVPIWKESFNFEDRTMEQDAEGVLVVNTANQKFSEGMIFPEPIIVYPFTQFEPLTLTSSQLLARNNTTNNATYRGFQKWTIRLLVKSREKGFIGSTECYKVEYEAQWRPGDAANTWYKKVSGTWTLQNFTSGWHEMRLSVGYKQIKSARLVNCVDDDKRNIQGSLDVNGEQITSPTAAPIVLGFARCKPVDFSSFIRS
jgi:hypothetical protein